LSLARIERAVDRDVGDGRGAIQGDGRPIGADDGNCVDPHHSNGDLVRGSVASEGQDAGGVGGGDDAGGSNAGLKDFNAGEVKRSEAGFHERVVAASGTLRKRNMALRAHAKCFHEKPPNWAQLCKHEHEHDKE
jgi:hypothetical protein